MNRTESIGLVLFAGIALAMDGWFLASRCASSPPLHASALAVGVLLQAAAIAVPLLTNHFLGDHSLKVRLRMFAVGVFAGVISLPLMETALLFGDSIGEAKGFASAGYRCDYSRLFPDGMR